MNKENPFFEKEEHSQEDIENAIDEAHYKYGDVLSSEQEDLVLMREDE